jgi:hypothetical protein
VQHSDAKRAEKDEAMGEKTSSEDLRLNFTDAERQLLDLALNAYMDQWRKNCAHLLPTDEEARRQLAVLLDVSMSLFEKVGNYEPEGS